MPIIDFKAEGFQKVPKGLRKLKMFLQNSPECPPTPESIKNKILRMGTDRIKRFVINPDKVFAEYILSLPDDTKDYRWGMMRQIWITHFIDEMDFLDWVSQEIEKAKKILNIQ